MKRHLSILSLILLLLLPLFGACRKETHEPPAPRFYEQVSSINELVLARITVSKMAVVSDPSLKDAKGVRQTAEAIVDALKIGDRVAAYSYDTYLNAFIDLSQLRPEDVRVDSVSKTVDIVLPAIQTRIEGRDATINEEHYRVTGMRSKIGASERAQLKERMNQSLKKELAADSEHTERLTETARKNARVFFSNFCANFGYTANIKFHDSSDVLNAAPAKPE